MKKVVKLIGLILSTPVVLIIRLIRPFILIRFGDIRADRLGHLSLNTELYYIYRQLGLTLNNSIDLFYFSKPICNKYLLNLWKKLLFINDLVFFLYKANQILPFSEKHTVRMRYSDRDIYNKLDISEPILKIDKLNNSKGVEYIKSCGLDSNDPFVCILSRDSAYLNKQLNPNKDKDWSYHNHRNSDINQFFKAAFFLTEKKINVFRMGAIVNKPFLSENKMIIDYASHHRKDYLDIYLASNCLFYLGDSCGFDAAITIFRRPKAITNYIPFEYYFSHRKSDMVIFKKIWLIRDKRFLTFKEIISYGLSKEWNYHNYSNNEIEIVDNSPDEICELAKEMYKKNHSSLIKNEEEIELQTRFNNLIPKSNLHGELLADVSPYFLKKNSFLLN